MASYKLWISSLVTALGLSFSVASGTVFAQTSTLDAELKADLAERQPIFIKNATKRLQLSGAQKVEFEKIVKEDAAKKQAAINKHAPLDSLRKKRALRADIHKIDSETDDKLSQVLSEQQLAEYKLMREENRNKALKAVEERKKNQ
jgi:hypothetical protein